MSGLGEKTRLFQAAQFELARAVERAGDGYRTDEERQEIVRLERELSMCKAEMERAWLRQAMK
jgi:hypothetical protein